MAFSGLLTFFCVDNISLHVFYWQKTDKNIFIVQKVMQTEIFPFHRFSTDFLEIEFAAKNGPETAQNIDKKSSK